MSKIIGQNIIIAQSVVLPEDARIGDFAIIGHESSFDQEMHPTQIGKGCMIRSHSVIYAGNVIGIFFQTGHGVLIREFNIIGDHVSVGTHSVIEHHTKIGNHVRIHTNAFIPEYSVIEDGAWIGPNVVLTNALYPASPNAKANLKGVRVLQNAKIGANATILPGVTIGINALIGAGSVVAHDVLDGKVVVGNPARIIGDISDIPDYKNFLDQEKGKLIMQIPMVDLKAQYAAIRDEIDPAIQQVLDQTDFISGKTIKKFEQHFAEYTDTKGTVGVASGTTAIHLALLACGVGKDDEVITTAHTFAATGEAIVHAGAIPIFVDIDPRTYLIDPVQVEAAITSKTKAILPVHLYGLSANMNALGDIAERHGLWLIEDAAQAQGARYHDKPCGSMGHLACFSFYPGKNLGAYGDAGAVTGCDLELLAKVRQLHDHGRSAKYTHEIIGFGERLDTLQAAVLDVKLKYLEKWNDQRRTHATLYSKMLADVDVVLPYIPDGLAPIFHQYVIRTPKRNALLEFLKSQGIDTGIHYPIPLHQQPAFIKLGLKPVHLPETEACANEVLSLPIYPELTEIQIEYVVGKIKQYFNA